MQNKERKKRLTEEEFWKVMSKDLTSEHHFS